MKFAAFTVAAMIAGAAAAPLSEEQYQFLFTKFSQQFNKSYEVGQVFSKYQTFKNNIDLIVAHNARNESFTMGVNQFADLTQEEFSQFMGLKAMPFEAKAPATPCPAAAAKAKANRKTIDWRKQKVGDHDAINQVKDQAQCGSCWAFSTMGSLEPQYNIANGQLFDLAEQQLVDCDTTSSGCNGGLMTLGLDYIKNVAKGKVALTKDYPYTARDGKCNTDAIAQGIDSGLTGYKVLDGKKLGAEEELIEALVDGPVSIALAASSSAFQFYKSGVVSNCSDHSVNHGVVLVGYYDNGKDDEGSEFNNYYVVRNSWGSSWGAQGYIRLAADKDSCGLVDRAAWNVQPTVAKKF